MSSVRFLQKAFRKWSVLALPFVKRPSTYSFVLQHFFHAEQLGAVVKKSR